MIECGYKSITRIEARNILREFNDNSFMYNSDPIIKNIMNVVSTDYGGGHTGCSIGYTMRILERISQLGFNPLLGKTPPGGVVQ